MQKSYKQIKIKVERFEITLFYGTRSLYRYPGRKIFIGLMILDDEIGRIKSRILWSFR